jgi:tRNA threonylcarbamoyladenosine biosynthesis protein TsaE
MATLISHSPEETAALGEEWGRRAQSGWVIGLSGELGAGKTQLVKGLARGLGITVPVLSPSFNLVHQYQGRLPLFHLDLYRLETPSQIIGAGLEEYFYQPPGVAVIEWVERWFAEVPRSECAGPASVGGPALLAGAASLPYRRVVIESLGETERRITYEDSGA